MTNKETILQTALTLFAGQGFDRTPTSQIAREAGVSEGLIFRHFGHKAGLLEAMLHEGLAQIAASMQAYDDDGLEPREAIARHIERSFSLVREQETFWRLLHRIRFQAAVQVAAGAQFDAATRLIVGRLTENFAKAGAPQPGQEAQLLFALIDGITLHYLDAPADYPLDDLQQLLTDKYRHARFLD